MLLRAPLAASISRPSLSGIRAWGDGALSSSGKPQAHQATPTGNTENEAKERPRDFNAEREGRGTRSLPRRAVGGPFASPQAKLYIVTRSARVRPVALWRGHDLLAAVGALPQASARGSDAGITVQFLRGAEPSRAEHSRREPRPPWEKRQPHPQTQGAGAVLAHVGAWGAAAGKVGGPPATLRVGQHGTSPAEGPLLCAPRHPSRAPARHLRLRRDTLVVGGALRAAVLSRLRRTWGLGRTWVPGSTAPSRGLPRAVVLWEDLFWEPRRLWGPPGRRRRNPTTGVPRHTRSVSAEPRAGRHRVWPCQVVGARLARV